jgi:phage baseplate assembly protein gpV
MIRNFFPAPLALLLCACSSSSSPSGSPSPDGGNASCPSVAGTWNITAHCDASFIGQSVAVTQTDCALSFAAPFNGFMGTVTSDGTLTLSGPQTCTGTVTSSSISMTCTPGTCVVTLAR